MTSAESEFIFITKKDKKKYMRPTMERRVWEILMRLLYTMGNECNLPRIYTEKYKVTLQAIAFLD